MGWTSEIEEISEVHLVFEYRFFGEKESDWITNAFMYKLSINIFAFCKHSVNHVANFVN